MFLLASIMGPEFGLFFWTALIFLVFFFILRRFAWKPILNMLHEREASIEQSLSEAKAAREQMSQLKAENEDLLREARAERDKILKEANQMRDRIVNEARQAAAEATEKEKEKARLQIEGEKQAALAQIRDAAATIAVEVAEKILRKEFQDKRKQEAFAKELISDLTNN